MPARRVVLFSNRSVFAAGVQELLQSVPNVALSVVDATDPDAMKTIRTLKPDVVVVDTGDATAGRASVVRALEARPEARVVALSLNKQAIDVYRMKRVIQTDLVGLLCAIDGAAGPRAKGASRGARHKKGATTP